MRRYTPISGCCCLCENTICILSLLVMHDVIGKNAEECLLSVGCFVQACCLTVPYHFLGPSSLRNISMALKMAYNMLSDVNPNSKHWKICVRVSRLWEYRGNVDSGSVQHLDLVLVDEQGGAMYAEIPADYIEAKRSQLQEGCVYALSRFLVCSNKERYRAVDCAYMIEITYYTKIEEMSQIAPNFPMYTYKLIPFADLTRYVGENRSFLDVIGVVTSVSNAVSVQGANQNVPSLKRVITLKDASDYAVKLTLWGQRASEFDGDHIFELGQAEPIVILFVGVLMKRYGYEEGLTGNAACRWYVCPNVSEATALKNSLHANFEPISRIVLRDQIPQATILTGPAEEKTIQEILEINPYDFPPTGLRCTVTIAKLSPGQSWWFFSCNKCSRKSVPDGTSYKCSSCLCRTAKPRYKLCVIGTDGTANAEFMLFGDIGQQVVGKQVGAVLRSNSGTDTIPPDIAQIVTKKYTWHVSITEKSFQGPKKSYQVSRIIVALGRQSAIPRITCSPNPISSPLQIVTSDVTPNCPLETTPPPQQMCSNKPEKQQSNKEPYATLGSTRKRLFDAQSASTQHTEPDSCSKKKLLVVDETDRLGFVQTKLQSVPEQQITKDISTCTDVAQKNSGSEINK